MAVELPPECSDSLKAVLEAKAALAVWNDAFAGETLSSSLFILKEHVLPVPNIVSNLIFACACMTNKVPDVNSMKDVCGDVSWESIRSVCTILNTLLAHCNIETIHTTKQKQMYIVMCVVECIVIVMHVFYKNRCGGRCIVT